MTLQAADADERGRFVSFDYGDGAVSALVGLHFARNQLVGTEDNADLPLAPPQPDAGSRAADLSAPGAPVAVGISRAARARRCSLAVAALVALWLWRIAPRFGPVQPDPPPARRRLLDHLRASGRFYWAQGLRGRLIVAARDAALRRIARAQPDFAQAGQAERTARVAALAEIPPAEAQRFHRAHRARRDLAGAEFIRTMHTARTHSQRIGKRRQGEMSKAMKEENFAQAAKIAAALRAEVAKARGRAARRDRRRCCARCSPGGHVLIEGVPGLGKTLLVRALARTHLAARSRASSSRPTSCRPTSPATRCTTRRASEFTPRRGPVFTNLLLADEINRAPAKTQAALLEVMQERQVTIEGQAHRARRRRSWCSPRRTRSSTRAPIRCPRRSSTASCSRCASTTRRRPTRWRMVRHVTEGKVGDRSTSTQRAPLVKPAHRALAAGSGGARARGRRGARLRRAPRARHAQLAGRGRWAPARAAASRWCARRAPRRCSRAATSSRPTT